MKLKDKSHIQSETKEELLKDLTELRKVTNNASVNKYTKPSKNVREGREVRKKIALIEGILRSQNVLDK